MHCFNSLIVCYHGLVYEKKKSERFLCFKIVYRDTRYRYLINQKQQFGRMFGVFIIYYKIGRTKKIINKKRYWSVKTLCVILHILYCCGITFSIIIVVDV